MHADTGLMELNLRHLYRCIRGFLNDKLVVLVTHQVHFALQGDKLLALKDVRISLLSSRVGA